MATFTKPLVSAAALASAAAVAVATPAIMPSISAPATTAIISAKVDLTSIATLLSLTAEDYINTTFSGYGFAVGPNQPANPDWAASFVGTNCNFDCSVNGISGDVYMALDALINGNDPYTPTNKLKYSALNYFFEGGASPGLQYLVTEPFGNPKSKLYNPTIAGAIALAFQGSYALTTLYIQALNTVAALVRTVPLVGPYIFGGINAYLGPNSQDYKYGDWSIYAGLSGDLRYVLDVIASGGNPYPNPPIPQSGAAVAAVPAAAAAVALPAASRRAGLTAVKDSAASASETKVETSVKDTTSEDVAGANDATEVKDSTTKVEAPDTTGSTDSTPETEAPESTPEPTKPSVDVPAADVATPAPAEAPAKQAPKRPLRDAVEKVGKQISSAFGGHRAARSGAAKASASSADSAS